MRNVETHHPDIGKVLAPDATLETVVTGFEFTEGPIWHPYDHHLTFSDIPADKLYRLDANGNLIVFREPSNKANGNTYDRQGRILSCEHTTRCVVRQELDGTLKTLASHFNDKALNSPNDIIVQSNGDIYFTDPTYGRSQRYGRDGEPELSFQGVFRLEPDTGTLSPLADDFDQPNGLCLSLDEGRLFVSDTPRQHIRVFDVLPDGQLRGDHVWAETAGEGHTAPDGLKIDAAGNVFSGTKKPTTCGSGVSQG